MKICRKISQGQKRALHTASDSIETGRYIYNYNGFMLVYREGRGCLPVPERERNW